MLYIKNLEKKYKDFTLKIDNLKIEKNKITGFLGINGSGKTTLMKSIFNLVKIESGEILYENQNIFKNHNLKKIAFFPDQNTIPLDLNVEDYWNYLAILLNLSKKAFKEKEEKLLQLTGMKLLYKKRISQLSSGEKKRALMGAVLIGEPELIFFDEPTANMDIIAAKEMIKIIKELNKIGVGIFITSHIVDELQDLINHLIIIRDGKIMYDKNFDKNKQSIFEIYQTIYKNENAVNSNLIQGIYVKEKPSS